MTAQPQSVGPRETEVLTLARGLPAFAAELQSELHRHGRADLASQVASLWLVDRCRCGDSLCTNLYVAARPGDAGAKGRSSLELDCRKGGIFLDLEDDRIQRIEVLHRPDVRTDLLAVLP